MDWNTVHGEEEAVLRRAGARVPAAALCLSGGGIRSATFALGVLQGLAEGGLLPRFDYLSTVSGGGYIGAWLTAWKQRAGGLGRILPALEPGAASAAVEHLRAYNNYLAPRTGAFSVDTWTLAAAVIRNVLLNWLVFLPVLLLILLIPRGVVTLAATGMRGGTWPLEAAMGLPVRLTLAPPLLVAGLLLAGTLFTGVTSGWLHTLDREWMARAGAVLLLTASAWLGGFALVLLVPGWVAAGGTSRWARSIPACGRFRS